MSKTAFLKRDIKPTKASLINKSCYIDPQNKFIRIIDASSIDISLSQYVRKHKRTIEQQIDFFGGILFRNFSIVNAKDFQQSVLAFGDSPLGYIERAAAREEVEKGIFTSTEFSSAETIELHHELSFSRRIPGRIFFFSRKTADKGGQTPLADEYKVTDGIDPNIKDEFFTRGLLYRRNYLPEIDMDWTSAFQTHNRNNVDNYCEANEISTQWLDGGRCLRTEQNLPSYIIDPKDNKKLFFNHAHIFHQFALEEVTRNGLLCEYGATGLPRNVFFGDGKEIPDSYIAHIRDIYECHKITFEWQPSDLLVLNNIRCLHGRNPFEGNRSVLVSMTQPIIRSI